MSWLAKNTFYDFLPVIFVTLCFTISFGINAIGEGYGDIKLWLSYTLLGGLFFLAIGVALVFSQKRLTLSPSLLNATFLFSSAVLMKNKMRALGYLQ
jgi:hypothetical protein